ncbi:MULTISPECIES: hypothetical protein [Marinitoga]|jgi:hypothetical protein|uniref:hypothetical protein n=1 Tax=Marinitoga TaxID=160798 RepID=UPI0013ECBB4E|nr:MULTISPECIES: hypothetical protein [Marinitoga]KAF2955808.1 hypothetical protein AS160_09200 [Marinitoga sp. 38H-ov]MBM7558828.1 hypothetical protein [Marinitoga litoralis]
MKKLLIILLLLPLIAYASITVNLNQTKVGMMQTLFNPIVLSQKPSEILVYPNLEKIQFGKINIGNSYFNVITGIKNNKRVIIVDSNNNKNLTDDYTDNYIFESLDNKIYDFTTINYNFEGQNYEYTIVLEYFLDKFGYFGITRKESYVDINGKKYKMFIADTNSDGIYDLENIILGIDLNFDYKYESNEIFRKFINIDGENYEVTEISKNGERIVFNKTNENIISDIGNKFSKTINLGNKRIELESNKKWKIILFAPLNKEYNKIFKYLNDNVSDKLEVKILLLVNKEEKDNIKEIMKKEYSNLEVTLIEGINDYEIIQEKMKLLYPHTIIILNQDNTIVYKTKAEIFEEEPIWKIQMPTLKEEFKILRIFIENVLY